MTLIPQELSGSLDRTGKNKFKSQQRASFIRQDGKGQFVEFWIRTNTPTIEVFINLDDSGPRGSVTFFGDALGFVEPRAQGVYVTKNDVDNDEYVLSMTPATPMPFNRVFEVNVQNKAGVVGAKILDSYAFVYLEKPTEGYSEEGVPRD